MKLNIKNCDITKLKVDAIVNAANNDLHHGGGVCGAIFDAAGASELERECSLLCYKHGGEIPSGKCVTSLAYALPCSFIIHAVGAIVGDHVTFENKITLVSAYLACLNEADELGIASIAFPCLSTGIYNFPNDAAAKLALQATTEWLKENENTTSLKEIVFVCFKKEDYDIYTDLVKNL